MNEKEKQEVPFYVHEAACDKIERTGKAALDKLEKTTSEALKTMDTSNKRMLTALIVVSLTLLVVVFGFLNAYKVMTKTWVGFIDDHFNEATEEVEGASDGLFVQDDTEDNQRSLEG